MNIIAPISARNNRIRLKQTDIDELQEFGVQELFKRKAREVAALNMYDAYYRDGWTPWLAQQTRRHLAPIIVHTVTLIWYSAAQEAAGKKAN